MAALEEESPQLNMKNVIGRYGSSVLSQGRIHLPHPGCSNHRLCSCSKAIKARPQNTAHQGYHHRLSPSDAPGAITASPSGERDNALRHTSPEGGNSTSYSHDQRLPPSPSQSGQLRGILPRPLHARVPPLLPLSAAWPPPAQLLSHPGVRSLQRETLDSTVSQQGEASGDTPVSQLWGKTP